jgi:hypothetical protein
MIKLEIVYIPIFEEGEIEAFLISWLPKAEP